MRPFTKGDPRAAEGARKGAITRKLNNQKKRDMMESAKRILSLALRRGDIVEVEDLMNMDEAIKANLSIADAVNIVMAKRALAGDVQAATFIRDMAGQKPTDKVQIDQSLTIESWAKNHKPKL